MGFYEFLTAGSNAPFLYVGVFALALVVIEIIGALAIGVTASSMIDIDGPADGLHGVTGFLSDGLDYLHFGKVPVIIIGTLLLLAFSASGYHLQWLWLTLFSGLLPWWIAVFPSLIGAIVVTHYTAGLIRLVMPKDTAPANDRKAFFGLIGTVTLGPISAEQVGEVRLVDQRGSTNFLLAKATPESGEIAQHEEVVIAGWSDSFFTVAKARPSTHS